MKSYKVIALAAAVLTIVSCGSKARVECVIAQAPQSDIVIKQLNVNTYDILDTVKTDKSGALRYKLEVLEGQPEFVYLFYGDTKIASLLLEKGDKAIVEADTLGNYTVTGSEESAKLQEVEKRFSKFAYGLAAMVVKLDDPNLSAADKAIIKREISKMYIDHYRESVKYVMENTQSLTAIPVLYEKLNDQSPVFSQVTDALHFRTVYENLKTVYPESKYVKALEKEAQRREGRMELAVKINNVLESGFPDIVMPDINGQDVRLSEVDSKVIMVHFWANEDPTHKMFNLEQLKPLYDEFHSKGFEIYSVCVDSDKVAWATTVKNQKLPWINVNDGLGWNSPVLETYNVQSVPCTYIIANGNLTASDTVGEASIRREIARILK